MSLTALLIAVVLLGFNAFFVAVEISLLAARRGIIEVRAEAGDRRAIAALRAMRELSVTFSGAQLGITLMSLGLGAVAEPAVAAAFKSLLGRTALPEAASVAIAIGLALAVVVFLHMVVGEMAPKNLAIARAEELALIVARPFALYVRAFRPLIVLLNAAANGLARAVGVTVVDERELGYGSEELLLVLGQARESGSIDVGDARLFAAVLELRDVDARSAMTPRIDLDTVATDMTIGDVLEAASASGHTRLPVYEGDVDHVVGIVHVKDLLVTDRDEATLVTEVMRPIVAVPESRDLESLLRELLQSRAQAAIVIDEFGGTAGLVTLEDVFEELVGDIVDEFDDEPSLVALGPRSWIAPGTMRRDDLADLVGIDLEEDDEESEADTVSGWMVDRLGRLLEAGDVVTTDAGWRLEVRSLEGRRAGRIAVRAPQPGPGAAGERSSVDPDAALGAGSGRVHREE
jgi:CBS domain containing-hemolysin-like protein